MKKNRFIGFSEKAISVLSAFLICCAVAIIAVITMGFLVIMVSRQEITMDVLGALYLASFTGAIALFLIATQSQRVRSFFGITFAPKAINARRIALIFMIIAILVVCFAVAHGLVSAFFAVIGSMPEAQSTREFWGLNVLLWALLLFLVKRFLWAKLPFGSKFISRREIVQGLSVTIIVAAVIMGAMVVAYFLAFILFAIFMGQRVPGDGHPFFDLLWLYSGALIFLLLRWYLRHSNVTGNIRLLSEVMNALESIACGDYSVRLNHSLKEDEPFAKLVKGVNEMTLTLERTEAMRQEFISNVSHPQALVGRCLWAVFLHQVDPSIFFNKVMQNRVQ